MGFFSQLLERVRKCFDRRTLGLLVTLIITITLPLTIFLAQQTQNIRQRASTNGAVTILDATTDQPITKTTTPDVKLRIALPDGWELLQSTPNGRLNIISKSHAQTPIESEQTATDSCSMQDSYTGKTLEDGQAVRYTLPIQITATRSNPLYYLAFYRDGRRINSFQEDAFSIGGGVLGQSDGPTSIECRIQTKQGDDATIIFSKKIMLNRDTPTIIPSSNDSCEFANLTDGQTVEGFTPPLQITSSRSNPSYWFIVWIKNDVLFSSQKDSASVSPIDMNRSLPDGSLSLECRIQADRYDQSTTLFSKKITIYKQSTATPASSPSPSPSPTPTIPTSPIPTPTVHILQGLSIENKDTDGSSGGHESFQITSNFNDYLNKPVYWKLNELKSDQNEATRVVQVTLFDGVNYFPYVATITLSRPGERLGRIQFPQDEGQHDTNVEWWYLNFHHLESQNKAGVIAVARLGTPDNSRNFLLVENIDLVNKTFQYRIYQGRLTSSDQGLDLDFQTDGASFRLRREDAGNIRNARYSLSIATPELTVERRLANFNNPILEGGAGYVPIAPGVSSFYYSLADLRSEQTVGSKAWMDHQWFNSPSLSAQDIPSIRPNHEWFSVQLGDGTNLVFWEIYDSANRVLFRNMDVQTPSGQQTNLPNFTITPLVQWQAPEGQFYNRKWRVQEATKNIDLTIETTVDDQVVARALYEGATRVNGKVEGRDISGLGFAELTHRATATQTASMSITGDVDQNGEVDIKDLDILVNQFGKSGPNIPSDLDRDGDVDIFDYNILVENFGKRTP